MLDELDRKLLNLIQTSLPLTAKPYWNLAERLGIAEEDVLERLRRLKDAGIIRRLGAIFDSRKLGYKGVLCALKVPPERVLEVARVINEYPGVTHNYLRNHEYNVWFTLLEESGEKLNITIKEIKDRIKVNEFLLLPALSIFKIKVNFNTYGEKYVNQT